MTKGVTATVALIAVVVVQTAIGQATAPNIATTSIPRTTREWKVLRSGARTAEDFDALAKYCETQVGQYRKREADRRAELREYYAAGNFYTPKNVLRRDQVLQSQIESCQKKARRWSTLSDAYSRKATVLREASSRR